MLCAPATVFIGMKTIEFNRILLKIKKTV